MTLKLFTIVLRDGAVGIQCPTCSRISYNVGDVRQKYCGACKVFLVPEGLVIPREDERERALIESAARMTEPLECPEGSNWATCLWCSEGKVDGSPGPVVHTPECPWTAIVALREHTT